MSIYEPSSGIRILEWGRYARITKSNGLRSVSRGPVHQGHPEVVVLLPGPRRDLVYTEQVVDSCLGRNGSQVMVELVYK